VVIRPRSYHRELVILGKLISENKPLIDAFVQSPYNAEHLPGFTVRMGAKNYLINLKYVAEYYSLCESMNYSQFEIFLKHVKEKSMLLMPGVRVN